ncbi:MAG: RimK family alpha-L-glutamate ligase [Desulfurococcaceae archaeon]
MKIAVIEYRKTPPATARELMKAIEVKGHTPVYLKAHLLDARLMNRSIEIYHGNEIVEVEGALLRNFGLFLNLDTFLKRLGVLEALANKIPVVNNPSATLITRDKWRCLLRLHLNNLPVPETLITENPFSAMRFTMEKKAVVYKPLMGSLGLGSTLIKDPDLSFQVTRSLKNLGLPSYYQVYLEKPGYDYRIFVVGDDAIGAMKRISNNWKTNIAQGAVGLPVRESEEPEPFQLALKATKVLGLDYAGVDVAYDVKTDKYYILEVNAFPHWEGLRKATGVNPPDAIVNHLINRIRK